jgi:RNase P subunit RPR2
MKKTICNKCRSQNIEVVQEEYHGEYTTLTYKCLDCNHINTNYYDIIFNPLNTFFASTTQKEAT